MEIVKEDILSELEQEAIKAIEDGLDARGRFVRVVYSVLSNEYWKLRPEYEYAKDWINELSKMTGVGVSTIKAYYSAVRVGAFYGYSLEESCLRLPILLKLYRIAETDRKTGEVLDTSPTDVVEAIEELSSDPGDDRALKPRDVTRELERRFAANKANVWFSRDGDSLRWHYDNWDEDGMYVYLDGEMRIELFDDPPEGVWHHIEKDLRVKDE